MSYILDALKRADIERERERGTVPGLHSQPVLPPVSPADDSDSRGWLWAAGGAVAVVLAGLAWYRFGPAIQITSRVSEPSPRPVSAPLPPPAITAITAVPTSSSAPAVGAVAPAAPPEAAPAPADVPAPTARQSAAAQANAARRSAAQEAAADRNATRTEARAQRTPEAPPPTVLPTPAEPIYSFNELPANIRSELPAVVIGGSSYSPNPKFRLLMINGQMYQEREKPLPNLVLEQINPKSAVLNYKGYRYRISY